MKQPVDEFNALPRAEAETELMKCCGSSAWARDVAAARPFVDMNELLATADRIWWSLNEADWLEAFSHHPQIGEKKSERPQTAEASRWSEQEQSGTRDADAQKLAALASANRSYLQKFGYIFIVCATGKSTSEMLSLCEQRLQNEPETELRIAAEEQRR
ncbi:MAG TPA: 2-oxo-4-hydroxy-4-carboxy-5-ureidoimidazoline decarboxylase, partial [Pyrinomonadaceae bacterium]|nr:2-oxo-4-hydroxy-4-carboxy-5-ureidoimidazoline decarboxylase [Pyrinomonadaceae bacterium]